MSSIYEKYRIHIKHKEYLICIRKWNDYPSDEQATLRAWYRKYDKENKEQEKQRYRQYYKENLKKRRPDSEELKLRLQMESDLVDEES